VPRASPCSRSTSRRRGGLAAGCLALAAALAACGGSPSASTTLQSPAPAPVAASPTAPADPPASSAAPTPQAREASGAPVTLAFGGDVHFEGVLGKRLARDPSTVFGPVSKVLSGADVAMVNLETAVTTRGTPGPKQFTFRAPPTAFAAVKAAGVDVVTLANNHGMDFGQQGLSDTLEAAEAAGVPLVGAGRDLPAALTPWRTTVKGQRISVFGATQVLDAFATDTWPARPDRAGLVSAKGPAQAGLLQAVRAERERADTIVVDLHWGQERNSCPLPRQRDLARELATAGADIVVGSHAHVLLGGGWLADGPGAGAYVDYGLGNFVFYAKPGPSAQSGVLRLTVQGRAVTAAEWVPAVIIGGQPVPATGARVSKLVTTKDALRERCTDLSAQPPG